VNKKPAWYELRWSVGLGLLIAVIIIAGILLATVPSGQVSVLALPEEIKPVTVKPTQPPSTPTPAATATIIPSLTQPTPTPNLAPKTAPADAGARVPIAPGSIDFARRPVELLPTPTPSEATPEPTPVPTATPLPPLPGINPTYLRIPTLGINGPVEYVGIDRQQRMDVPSGYWNVGWFKLGVKPGERGNAVFAGHVDGPSFPAIFWDLRKIQVNTKIYIRGDRGEEKVFEVFDIGIYPYDDAPLDRIFGGSNDAQIVLITCTGTFDQANNNYDKRFVAYARLVQ
jgi:sortase A